MVRNRTTLLVLISRGARCFPASCAACADWSTDGHEVSVIAVISDPSPERARRLYATVADLGVRWSGVNIEEQEGVNQRSNQQPIASVRAFWAALLDAAEDDGRVQLRDISRALTYVQAVLEGRPGPTHP